MLIETHNTIIIMEFDASELQSKASSLVTVVKQEGEQAGGQAGIGFKIGI